MYLWQIFYLLAHKRATAILISWTGNSYLRNKDLLSNIVRQIVLKDRRVFHENVNELLYILSKIFYILLHYFTKGIIY